MGVLCLNIYYHPLLSFQTRKLNNYRMRFDEKTKEIEKLYVERVDQLY